jgi:hypothetical protein
VTETWDLTYEAPITRPFVAFAGAKPTERNMSRTLERIEQLVTS